MAMLYGVLMAKKISIGLVVILLLSIGLSQLQNYLISRNKEGLFKIGGCYRDDEFGLLYRIESTVKGQTSASILESTKYPTQYKVDERRHWPSNNNLRSLYPVACP
jgi:hypothetical protein